MSQHLIPWTTGSGNIVLNYTGSGNETVTIGSSTDNDSYSPRSQVLTITTTAGGTISRTVTITQSGKTVPVGTIYNFAYTGTVQSQELPAGTYKLQVWGAQGGSNAAASSYGITSQAGGKGGYSEGILTLTSPTTIYIFVGGQPSTSSTNGGWNGGGGGSGTSTNGTPTTATYGLGYTKVGRGGGATDIALTTSTMSYSDYRTNRSSASLLSRFIVAGGGSGGAMAYQEITSTSWQTIGTITDTTNGATGIFNGVSYTVTNVKSGSSYVYRLGFAAGECPFGDGETIRITFQSGRGTARVYWYSSSASYNDFPATSTGGNPISFTHYDANRPSASCEYRIQLVQSSAKFDGSLLIEKEVTTTTTNTASQIGYAGGGVEGIAGTSGNSGKQGSAGNGGGFGYGHNQSGTTYRYVGAPGGGGWYGGGSSYNSSTVNLVTPLTYSGGGSGFVNIAANAQYRPSGYTGLELDSGVTYDGETSFPSTSGTNETGHSGNGYARITCVGNWEAKLPAGYTLLDYIENVNSAYINTGVNAANDIGIHIEYEDNYTYGSSSNYVVGARATSSSTILIGISGSSSGNTSNISYNGSSVNLGVTRSKGKKYVVDLQADSTGLDYRYVIDGSEAKTGRLTKTLSATSTPICLFGFNSSNIKKNTRISRCYITDGGDVVRYFLPCKNASNVVGLYDCANGVFYGSANSNTFTAGNVIS